MSFGEENSVSLFVGGNRMEEFLRQHIARGREHAKKETKRMEELARLNLQMIYLTSAGSMPNAELRELDSMISGILGENVSDG